METKHFNIIRELYINPENRNLLKVLLEYINSRDRGHIVISLHKEEIELGLSMCIECYKICEATFSRCVGEISGSFCKSCHLEHIIKYTGEVNYHVRNRDLCFVNPKDTDEVFIMFKHSCTLGDYSTYLKMKKLEALDYLKRGIFKENIIDYINDGYDFEWHTWY